MAATYDFTIEQGADLDLSFTCQDDQGAPVDLTGFTASAAVQWAVDGSLDLAPTVTDAAGGVITVHVAGAVTDVLSGWGVGTWTLEVTDGSQTLRFLQGRVTLSERTDPQWL